MTLSKQFSLWLTLLICLATAHPLLASQNKTPLSQVEKDYRYGKTLVGQKRYETAIRFLKAAAHKGHSRAQYDLGILYYQQKQYKKARFWLRKRSNDGHADAQFHYANTFRYGLGTKQQTTLARRLYQKAAKQGHVNAQFELAKMFEQGIGAKKNMDLARKWYETAAKNGNNNAKVALKALKPSKIAKKTVPVVIDEPKEEVPALPDKSEVLFAKASKGDAEQQYQLAMRYLHGYDIASDINQAIHWLELAAAKNHPMAEYQLANQYFNGQSIDRNIPLAVHFFHRAHKKGVEAATTALRMLASYGFETLVGAELGEKEAQYKIAMQTLQGETLVDKDKALRWLKESADQSYPPALHMMAQMYQTGDFFKRDLKLAFKTYLKAAELDDPNAQYALSKMYKEGLGTDKNQSLATQWLGRAAAGGNADAQKALQFSEL